MGALIGILVGSLLRTFLPYFTTGLEIVAKENTWKAWPQFQWKYLTMFILSLIGYGVTFLTLPGTFDALLSWEFIASVALAYSGGDVGRQLIKGGAAVVSMVNGR